VIEILNKKNAIYIFRHLILAITFVLLIELLKYVFNVVEPEVSVLKENFLENFACSFFGVVAISPILEEVVFRLPLKKNNYYWVSIIFSLLFFLTSKYIVTQIMCLLFVGSIIVYQFYDKINLFRHILIILSIMAFVSVHFDNYELNIFRIVDIVILFLPQFVLSLILTKIRVQTCFRNSIIFHSLYNLIVLLFAFLFNF
jgi:hypothetical protein